MVRYLLIQLRQVVYARFESAFQVADLVGQTQLLGMVSNMREKNTKWHMNFCTGMTRRRYYTR